MLPTSSFVVRSSDSNGCTTLKEIERFDGKGSDVQSARQSKAQCTAQLLGTRTKSR